MARKRSSDATRIPKTVYLPPEVARRLEKAANKTDLSQSTYVVQALKAQFKRDGIE